MFFRDLKMKSTTMEVVLAEARLPVRLGHRDAAKVFGEPLTRQLAAAAMGTVTKVRAHEAGPDEICGVTLYLGLRDSSRSALETVASMLEHLKAPYGSSLRLSERGEPLVFGVAEGLEISVDSTLAPDAGSRRHLAKSCAEAMKGLAVSRGWSRRDNRTVFYFYGESFLRMQENIGTFLARHPLLKDATTRRLA